ncbi:hypothetical protein [Kordiimonas aestuarii]|uniref:hypothetical protein n=1 Tax=Kordiimonas aestuarii TaxID=1005925 RepID=UPI0021D2B9A7|nr:hypothetical protein [Kordiimonas aestuarii]
MKRSNVTALALWPLLMSGGAGADDPFPSIRFDFLADARVTLADGEPSWFKDWLGKGRYGGTHWAGNDVEGLRLAEASILAKAEISWDLSGFVHAKFDHEQGKPLDLVEAYLEYKPAPRSAISYEGRLGLMFPHISRENVGMAWTSPYTITPSAINSWVGEEIRALALEGKAKYRSGAHSLSLTAALFGFNDPAGTLLAFRGWALNDYKVGAFSQLPLANLPSIGADSDFLNKQPLWVHPVNEIDGRPGYYASLDWDYAKRLKAGVFYYDNRGDPEELKRKQYGWDTRFWNFYAEAEPLRGMKLISQYMTGSTKMGRQRYRGMYPVDVDFEAVFVLLSQKFERNRVSVRYDWFATDDNTFVEEDNNNEWGHAWTVALSREFRKHDQLILEYLQLDSWRPARKTIGYAADQEQSIIQISYRLRF